MQKQVYLFFIALFSLGPLFGQNIEGTVPTYLQLVGGQFKAERAFETTKFVADQWRVPGNTGFDTCIMYVKHILEEAGFVPEAIASPGMPHYRLEKYPLRQPAWDPLSASLHIKGQPEALLNFSSNRNMIAINSFSTPPGGVEAEVVYLKDCSADGIKKAKVKGKIVMAACGINRLFQQAVVNEGALGVLAYSIPDYNQPEKYQHSIPFRGISFNSEAKGWGINLSYAAKEALSHALAKGPLTITVNIQTHIFPSEELTLIAEIPGQSRPDERFVFSAHVQEPGANDNATGVGTLAEMARVAIQLYQKAQISPQRTLTFLWGDEIRSTNRFITQDSSRAQGIRWGVSLDMVGEDTEKTGGTFLIEKMPDPSAIWTRGEDKHSEWGSTLVSKADLNPHYFNDFIESVCRTHALSTNWIVNTNPFEGGSDHQPFLNAKIPGLLFWHFTDVFYHTDADRIDKVSPKTLFNVGVSALSSALVLCEGGEKVATEIAQIVETAAQKRLRAEKKLSLAAIKEGESLTHQTEIISTWTDWYMATVGTLSDMLFAPPSPQLLAQLAALKEKIAAQSTDALSELKKP
ncbi:MAG: M28 family peptidase [Saprospiraceae bacterium]